MRKGYFTKTKKNVKLNTAGVNSESAAYRSYLVKNGYPLVISGLSIALYTRAGQIILGNLESISTVGYYNAALTIAGGWSFLPIICMTSLLPMVLRDRCNKDTGFSFIYLIALLVSIPLIVLCKIFDSEIIYYTYGEAFMPSVEVFSVLAVSTLFSVFGVIGVRVIIANNGNNFLMKKMGVMVILNLVLTYVLLSEYGMIGAAYAILITEIISSTVANYFFKGAYVLRIQLSIPTSIVYLRCLINDLTKKERK
jgi:Membrane protein involved in the export of O-antigen and teichoic acid